MAQMKYVAPHQSLGFFRVLLPGFSDKLVPPFIPHSVFGLHACIIVLQSPQLLPPKLAEHVELVEGKSKFAASLVNPRGESWHVDVHREGGETMYVGGPGWLELARAHQLGLGYFLVFHHQGNMVFNFWAFDLSTSEITYPSIAQWVAEKLKRRPPVADVKEEEQMPSTASCEEHTEKTATNSCTTGGVHFEVELTAYNISRGDLNIPKRLNESTGLWNLETLTLKDPQGRLWPVRLRFKKSSGNPVPGCCMRNGWVSFARANNLKKGDRCIFELLGEGKEEFMQVKIFRKHY